MNAETVNAGSSPVERGVRAPDPERAAFEAWARENRHALNLRYMYDEKGNYHYDGYIYADTDDAFRLWQAATAEAGAWVKTSERKPRGGQLIVKRWKHGAVWAGTHCTHDEGPKNESFHEWKAL